MIRPARAGAARKENKPAAQPFVFPPSTRGLALSDNIAAAQPDGALILDNIFPMAGKLRARRGCAPSATGMVSPVEALMQWAGGSTQIFFAAAGDTIYDVSVSGTAVASSVTSLTNALLLSTVFTTSGGWFLFWVNGEDSPQYFNGSVWTTPAITGVTAANLANVWVHGARLWFAEKGTMDAWYLPVDQLAGSATKLSLGSSTQKGGYLVAGASTATGAGDGIAPYNVFVTSEGELVVYQGLDPATSATWAWVGTYVVGRPLGRRCFQRVQGDLLIMTEDGIFSLLAVMKYDRAAALETAITKPIEPLWRDLVRLYGGQEAWQMTLWSRESMMIVSLPGSDNTNDMQLVVNTTTGAWATFTGWPASCFGVYDNALYFGRYDGEVWQAEIGARDGDDPYIVRWMPVYSDFGVGFQMKDISLVRVSIRSSFDSRAAVRVRTDYAMPQIGPTARPPGPSAQGTWNVSNWNQFVWGPSVKTLQFWQGVAGNGSSVSIDVALMMDSVSDATCEINRMEVIFTAGALIN